MPICLFKLSTESLKYLKSKRISMGHFFEPNYRFEIQSLTDNTFLSLSAKIIDVAIENSHNSNIESSFTKELKNFFGKQVKFQASLKPYVFPYYQGRSFAHLLDVRGLGENQVELDNFVKEQNISILNLKNSSVGDKEWTEETAISFLRNNSSFRNDSISGTQNVLHLSAEKTFVFIQNGELFFLAYGKSPVMGRLNMTIDLEASTVNIPSLPVDKLNLLLNAGIDIPNISLKTQLYFQNSLFSNELHFPRTYTLEELGVIKQELDFKLLFHTLSVLDSYANVGIPNTSPIYKLFNVTDPNHVYAPSYLLYKKQPKGSNKLNKNLRTDVSIILDYVKEDIGNKDPYNHFSMRLKTVLSKDFINAPSSGEKADKEIAVKKAVKNLLNALCDKSPQEYKAICEELRLEQFPTSLKEALLSSLFFAAILSAFALAIFCICAVIPTGVALVGIGLGILTAIVSGIAVSKISLAESNAFHSAASTTRNIMVNQITERQTYMAEKKRSSFTLFNPPSAPQANVDVVENLPASTALRS